MAYAADGLSAGCGRSWQAAMAVRTASACSRLRAPWPDRQVAHT
jgi:hypothetical protein